MCCFQLWSSHALLTVVLGKWLLAIFHCVNAFTIYVRNGIYEGNKSHSHLFLSPNILVLRMGMHFLCSYVVYILYLELWLRETEHWVCFSLLVLCNTFFLVYVWEEFRVPTSGWGLRKKRFLWHAVVLFLTRNFVKDVFFVPVCYCATIHNDLSRYYLDERHCSCGDRFNQDDT